MSKARMRMLAKSGMTVSLVGVVVSASGTEQRRQRMVTHTWQGLALVGFSIWHYNLYLKKPSDRDK